MDGVLYDSMPNHVVAWHKSMAQFGIDMCEHDAYATEGARGVDTIVEMVKAQQKRIITLEEAQKMYDVKSRLFHEMPAPPIMPGIPELMEKIQKNGLSINVVTGSGQRPLIQRLLHDFGDFLEENHITTAYDVSRGKPNPDPYLMGLKKAGNLKPWEAIVVENAPLGIQAGHAACIFTIGVMTGPLPIEMLKKAGADSIYSNMVDLCRDWDSFCQQISETP
jgi:HAD superfamily hydrolase (TIGR01509 family)